MAGLAPSSLLLLRGGGVPQSAVAVEQLGRVRLAEMGIIGQGVRHALGMVDEPP